MAAASKKIFFPLLVIVVLGLIYYSNFVLGQPKASRESVLTSNCFTPTISEKTVILRVDDVQAFAWFETTAKMISDAQARRVAMTLGVIPVGLEEDTILVSFLKNHACGLEFALHGWDHSSGEGGTEPEFKSLSETVAQQRISPGVDALAQLTNDPIVTWIPPFNEQSTGTVAVLETLGFKYLSSEGDGEWDYDTATFEYSGDTLVAPEEVVADCENTFLEDTKCVIMLHPQDFADDLNHNEEKYQDYYLDLLDALKMEGYSFARFSDFN